MVFHRLRSLERCKSVATNAANRYKSTKSNLSQSSSLFDSANGYFSELRFKAANALTSSLPEDERNDLLQKLEPKLRPNEEEESTVPQISIAEAVAAARAQEAAIQSEKWENEKDKLLADAEQAARSRVESDIAIQRRKLMFEKWKQDVEKNLEEEKPQTASTEEENVGTHPVLGPIVMDLGHKRIHIVSAKDLASIPVWKKQRVYRHLRAQSMASDKIKSLHLGLPGIIGIYESKDGNLSIIDGQHRVGMLKLIQEKASSSEFDFDRILVEVYPQRDEDPEDHAKEIFLEVNKAEPVKLVDLPGVAKASHRNIINTGAEKLHERFPDMFKPSQRCRPPHLNIDNLRDALFASDVIGRHSLKSPKALEAWMIAQNELLATKFQNKEAKKLASEAALKKAQKFDFYLGLDSGWLYN